MQQNGYFAEKEGAQHSSCKLLLHNALDSYWCSFAEHDSLMGLVKDELGDQIGQMWASCSRASDVQLWGTNKITTWLQGWNWWAGQEMKDVNWTGCARSGISWSVLLGDLSAGAAVVPRPYLCAERALQLFKKYLFGIVCVLIMIHLFQFGNVDFLSC